VSGKAARATEDQPGRARAAEAVGVHDLGIHEDATPAEEAEIAPRLDGPPGGFEPDEGLARLDPGLLAQHGLPFVRSADPERVPPAQPVVGRNLLDDVEPEHVLNEPAPDPGHSDCLAVRVGRFEDAGGPLRDALGHPVPLRVIDEAVYSAVDREAPPIPLHDRDLCCGVPFSEGQCDQRGRGNEPCRNCSARAAPGAFDAIHSMLSALEVGLPTASVKTRRGPAGSLSGMLRLARTLRWRRDGVL
jgi:hypothetical protein